MENFVQMSLETYDVLKFNNEHLKRELKKEQESHSEDVAQAQKEIEQYKQYILGRNCKILDFENNSLEYYLDINSWNYGIDFRKDLLQIGFTKQEMDEFIANEYEEYVKEKQSTKMIE